MKISCVLIAAMLLSCGSSGSDDWYYHWSCNGDAQCLATNPNGTPTGTNDEGPNESSCTELLTFAQHFWGSAAVDSCDQNPNGAAGGPVVSSFTPASGAAGTVVTLTGTGLSGATVQIDGHACAVTSETATQIVCTIPNVSSFSGPFTVTTAAGNTTSSGSFTITPANPGSGQVVFVSGGTRTGVVVYDRTASVSAATPLRSIATAAVTRGLAFDVAANELYVNDAGGTVSVFPGSASGNAIPTRTLQTSTGAPILVDHSHGELYVCGGGEVLVFSSTATGSTSAVRTLQIQPASGPTIEVYGCAVDTINDELFVLTGNSTSAPVVVEVFARTASGTDAVKRSFTAFSARALSFGGIAVDAVNGEIWVTTQQSAGTAVFARTAAGSPTAQPIPLRTSTTSGGSGVYVDTVNGEAGLATVGGFTVLSRTTMGFLRSVSSGNMPGTDVSIAPGF